MVLDWSALAPGPAGTAMLGESGIEGAARRGRERIHREQAEKRELEKKFKNGDDTASEVTLIPTNQPREPGSIQQERYTGGDDMPRSSMVSDSDTSIKRNDGRRQRGGIKGKLSRFKKRLTG